MFTGIIETTGRIGALTHVGSGAEITIACPFAGALTDGQSVAVSGVCLTVTGADDHAFRATAVAETLARTTLGDLRPGDAVNLERAVRMGDRLDGHLVQGHVDGVCRVTEVVEMRPGCEVTLVVPDELARYVAVKGSVALDGVSLTVANVEGHAFRVALVPKTLEVTTLGSLAPGRRANIEVDVTARYVERLMTEREVTLE